MVIALINEGFANQLFRYCSAYAAARRLDTQLILIVQTSDAISDPFQLSEFGIVCSDFLVTKSQIETFVLIDELCKNYNLVRVNGADYRNLVMEGHLGECDGILMLDHYQEEGFFADYIDEIRQMLKFDTPSSFLANFMKEIDGKKSVGVHVRRGDYTYYGEMISSIDYYKAAMSLYETKFSDEKPQYYIFSDDIDYVKAYLGDNRRIHFVRNLGGFRESIEEFFALSMCNHHILTTVSSFGRLADTLCDKEDRLAIYDAFGYEDMVNGAEHRIFLGAEEVTQYAPLYDSCFNGECRRKDAEIGKNKSIVERSIDSFALTKEEEIGFRFEKIENEMRCGHYDIALGQIKKLWEMLFNSGTEEEAKMHELYFSCLRERGYVEESLVEALYLDDSYENRFSLDQKELMKKIKRNKCKVVIIPERLFNPMWYEDMVNIGIGFERLGYDVTFLFWELVPGMQKYNIFNKKLRTSKNFVKSRGTDTLCKQVDLNEKIRQFGTLRTYLRHLCADEKTIFIYKQKEVLEAIEDANLKNDIRIYYDESNIFDCGNFLETGDAITNFAVSPEEIVWLKQHSDFYITHGENADENAILVNFPEEAERSSMVDFDMTVSYNLNKIFSIINRLPETPIERKELIKNDYPLVSILIPVYNRVGIIEQTVDSALAQTYPNIEIIICDNKSTDGTFELLSEKYGNNPKVVLHQNESNGGPVYNWKQCFKRATGKYVKILWSDDIIAPFFVSKCVDVMERREDMAFAYSSSVVFREANNLHFGNIVHSLKKSNDLFGKAGFIKEALAGNSRIPVSPGCALFRREDVHIMDDIPNEIGVSSRMNGAGIDLLIFLLSFENRETFYYFGTPLSYFRYHEGSITVTNNLTKEYNVARAFYSSNTEDGKAFENVIKRKIMTDEGVSDLEEGNQLFKKYAINVGEN